MSIKFDVILREVEDKNIEELLVPENVTEMADDCLRGCKKLKRLILNDGLQKIGKNLLRDTLVEELDIPHTVTFIKEGALQSEHLKKVKFSKGLREIPQDICSYNMSLENVEIPEGITAIGERAFKCCQNLKEIRIPSTIRIIADEVFYTSGIADVEFSEGLTYIGEYAFALCKNLKVVSLPKTLEAIGAVAFGYNDNLHTFEIPEETNLTINSTALSTDFESSNILISTPKLKTLNIPKGITIDKYVNLLPRNSRIERVAITSDIDVYTLVHMVCECNTELKEVVLTRSNYNLLCRGLQDENILKEMYWTYFDNEFLKVGNVESEVLTAHIEDFISRELKITVIA